MSSAGASARDYRSPPLKRARRLRCRNCAKKSGLELDPLFRGAESCDAGDTMQEDAARRSRMKQSEPAGIPMPSERTLAAICGRVVRIGEAIADQDLGFAYQLARDLEIDIAELLEKQT